MYRNNEAIVFAVRQLNVSIEADGEALPHCQMRDLPKCKSQLSRCDPLELPDCVHILQEYDALNLSCVVYEDPEVLEKLRYEWIFHRPASIPRYVEFAPEYVIDNITTQHGGEYTCKARQHNEKVGEVNDKVGEFRVIVFVQPEDVGPGQEAAAQGSDRGQTGGAIAGVIISLIGVGVGVLYVLKRFWKSRTDREGEKFSCLSDYS